jgi:uncharacterized OsmC-like protein
MAKLIAQERNITLRSFSLTVEGDLDTAGYLGQPTEHRIGLLGIKMNAAIDADLSTEEKQRFLEEIDRRCPASETFQKGTIVSLKLV